MIPLVVTCLISVAAATGDPASVTSEDAVREVVVNDDALNDDAVNHDAANHDAVNDDAVNDDAVNDDAANDDAVNDDAVNDDAVNDDAVMNDAVMNDAVMNDTEMNDAVSNDVVDDDAVNDDAIADPDEIPAQLNATEREPTDSNLGGVDDEANATSLVDDPCLKSVEAGGLTGNVACFERAAAARPSPAREEILRAAEQLSAPPSSIPKFSLQSFFLSGKPELILMTTAHAATTATIVTGTSAYARNSFGPYIGPVVPLLEASLVLMSPLVGGGIGLATGAAISFVPDFFSDDDIHLMRAGIVNGAMNALIINATLLSMQYRYFPTTDYRSVPLILSAIALSALSGPLVLAVAASIVIDVPSGGSSLAMSSALLASIVTLCVIGATDNTYGPDQVAAWTLLFAHLAGGAALATSYFIPVHRIETWVIDLGIVAGLLFSAALVFGVPAGNPVTGYGGLAAGATLGAVGGYALAKLIPPVFNVLPSFDDVLAVPLLLPSLNGREVGLGVALSVPFSGATTREGRSHRPRQGGRSP